MAARALMASSGKVTTRWPLWDGSLDGTATVFNSGNSTNISIAQLSSTAVIVFYTDAANSSYATACVGVISGTSVSWGTPVVVRMSSMQVNNIIALSSTQALAVWRDSGDSSKCKAVVLDISGTSITVNTIATVTSSAIDAVYAARLSAIKAIVTYNVASTEGRAVVLTISGSSISVQTYFAFNGASNTAADCCVEAVSSSRAVLFYSDGANAGYGTAQVVDIDGSNVITGNTEHVFNSATTTSFRSATLSSGCFAVIYRDGANSNFATVQIIAVAGVTPSSGTKVAFNNVTAARNLMNIAKADSTTLYLFFRQVTSNKGAALIATASGTAVSLHTAVIVNNATSSEFACVALDNTHVCMVYKDQGNSNAGTGKVSRSG